MIEDCPKEMQADHWEFFHARRILAEHDEYCREQTEHYRSLAIALAIVITTVVLLGFGLSYAERVVDFNRPFLSNR